MGFLKFIEIENFKSYKGQHRIGPLKPLSFVIGPNGSGKSNFMDAIRFVFGERTENLRAGTLADLVNEDSQDASVVLVAAIYETEGEEIKYTRKIQGNSSSLVYMIDDNEVAKKDYLLSLKKLGINSETKNFLVPQGEVESLALKTPKEMRCLFEVVSQSIRYQKDYEQKKLEHDKARDDCDTLITARKHTTTLVQAAAQNKKDLLEYKKLETELAEKELTYFLFQLYYKQKELDSIKEKLERERRVLEEINSHQQETKQNIKSKNSLHKQMQKDILGMEKKVKQAEESMKESCTAYFETEEQIHHTSGLKHVAENLKQKYEKAKNEHLETIFQLETELNKIETQLKNMEAEAFSSRPSRRPLSQEEFDEYKHLKNEAGRISAQDLQKLNDLNRDLKENQDSCDNLVRQCNEKKSELHRVKSNFKENLDRLEKVNENLRKINSELKKLKSDHDELESSISEAQKKKEGIDKELQSVLEKLRDAKLDTNEQKGKRHETVGILKKIFPGIYDRLINLCQPIHKKYNVAVTKALGHNMEAIVVDHVEVARACITYLKEHMLKPETFLPLDYIQPKCIKERLRDIKEPKNVKLLFDVLKFHPENVRRAVLYATGNILVCETDCDAARVAYEMGNNEYYDVVSLKGTFFKKSGIISGGEATLARKARQWDNKDLQELKDKKENLKKELREVLSELRKEADLKTMNSQISGKEEALQYAIKMKDDINKFLADKLEPEKDKLQQEIESLDSNIQVAKDNIRKNQSKIDDIKNRLNETEDAVFNEFCGRIGIENIRQYEAEGLKLFQDRQRLQLELEDNRNRILNQLDYQEEKDVTSQFEKCKLNIENYDIDLNNLNKEAEVRERVMEEQKARLKELQEALDQKNRTLRNIQLEINQMEKELKKDVEIHRATVTSLERKQDDSRADRHSILMTCKMKDIKITAEDNNQDASQDTITDTESSPNTQQIFEREEQLNINYDLLTPELKEFTNPAEMKDHKQQLQNEISGIETQMKNIAPRISNADEEYKRALRSQREFEQKLKVAKNILKNARCEFEKIKKKRHDKFMDCFNRVSECTDKIYKILTENDGAQAFLTVENPLDPYLEGVTFSCIAPGKHFQPVIKLSGGERTIAVLALMFALHNYKPAPFFVFDEIDASLDNISMGKLARYLNEQTRNNIQCIIISLRQEFYKHADALIGVTTDPREPTVSEIITLDLSNYLKHP